VARSARIVAGLLAALVLGCSVEVPEGRFACATSADCPSGMECRPSAGGARRCFLPGGTALDAGPLDAARLDAARSDAGVVVPVDAGPPPCDSAEGVDESVGAFVREGGMGDGTSPSSPLGSLAAAIPLARTGRTHVYVATGTYTDVLDVTSPPAGLVIDGGWRASGGVWTRDCDVGREATLIAPPAPIAMRITDALLGIELRHLTIETSPPGAAGGSRVALVVQGTDSAVTLVDVHLHARGGEQGAAAGPAAPAPAPACDGTSSCSTGADGSGAGAGADAAPADAFDAAGYTPVDGGRGTPGQPGYNGMLGEMGHTAATGCCDLCNGGGGCSTTCTGTAFVPTGRCGCAGQPGGAGEPGRGGGASVGLLVVGAAATVSARWSTIESEAGGAGSAGGMPADPSTPTDGVAGSADCCTSCRVASACPACSCFRETCTTYSSRPGSRGGAAGASGSGGGGAGGPSYSVVTVGASFVADSATTSMLLHGAGGAGGGASNAGASGTVLRL